MMIKELAAFLYWASLVTHSQGSPSLKKLKGDTGDLTDIGINLSQHSLTHEAKSRMRRWLSFPSSSSLTFSNKLKIPVFSKFSGNIAGVFKGFIVAKYTLPSATVTVGRDMASERLQAYSSLESVFSSFGLNGHDCLLRAICEAADQPIAEMGLMGEILAMLFSPGHSSRETRSAFGEFVSAEKYGRDVGHCDLAYASSCPLQLQQLIQIAASLVQEAVTRDASNTNRLK